MGDNSDHLTIDTFEIDSTEFSLQPLKNEARLRLLPDILAMLAPLVHTGDLEQGQIDKMIAEGAKALDRLPRLTSAFEARCKWKRGDSKWQTGGWDVCFQRKTVLQLRWLLTCLRLEFGDFLDANGLESVLSEVNELTSPTS